MVPIVLQTVEENPPELVVVLMYVELPIVRIVVPANAEDANTVAIVADVIAAITMFFIFVVS